MLSNRDVDASSPHQNFPLYTTCHHLPISLLYQQWHLLTSFDFWSPPYIDCDTLSHRSTPDLPPYINSGTPSYLSVSDLPLTLTATSLCLQHRTSPTVTPLNTQQQHSLTFDTWPTFQTTPTLIRSLPQLLHLLNKALPPRKFFR